MLTLNKLRFPRFELQISTEVSDYHIVNDSSPEIDNESATDTIVSLTTKNAMGDDSSAFSIVLLGTTRWDELVRDNDLVIIKVQPNEQVSGQLNAIDEPTNDVITVGLVSEVRIEGSYEDDKKLFRITGQSFQKVFMNFELQIIQQVSATIPGQGWMDPNVGVVQGGGTATFSDEPVEFSPDASGSGPVFPTTTGRSISSNYGPRNTGIPGASTTHPAIDISGNSSDPIYATQDGVVTRTGVIGGWGNTIRIQHTGDGFHSQYAHLSSINVSEGQTVKKGQKIGNMGTTGTSSGVHLDFIVSKDGSFPHNNLGNTVNPVDYLGGSVNSASTGGGGTTSTEGGGGGAMIETDGGFTSLIANRTVRDVFKLILDRFTEYMVYNFRGQGEVDSASTLEDRLDYTNLDSWTEDEHLMNPLSISSFEGSLNQLLIDISTRPFNEFFFEVGYEDKDKKSPGTEKSFLVLRRTPFDKEDWEELHRAEVNSSHIMNENISVTDLDAYSIYNVVPEDLSDSFALINARPVFSPKLLPKYGYKMLEVRHKFLGFMDTGEGGGGADGTTDGNWQGGSNTDERLAFNQITGELGISDTQKQQWAYIIERESSWNMHAQNPSSGAYGLAQRNPSGGHTLTPEYKNSAYNQLTWMYNYMQERYGGITPAYNFWLSNNWY